jgi:hypothetical protein
VTVQGVITKGTRRTALLAAIAAAAVLVLIPALAERADAAGPTTIVSRTFSVNDPNNGTRMTVGCPNSKRFRFPYGGGMFSPTPYEADGAGVYPHSYERLGQQHGYHVTTILYDPTPGNATAHDVTLQVICGPEPGKLSPKHETATVNPGDSKTHNVTCTGKRVLLGGGFQRTDFTNFGGDYVTESYAVAPNVWRVSGTAFGTFNGELTGIAYCRKKGGTLTVSGTGVVQPHQVGSATTPPCPGNKVMTWTGFTTDPLGSMFFAGSRFDADDTVTGFAFNKTDAPANLTVFGYCNTVRAISKHH